MSSKFRLSALSLAVLIASATSVYAAKSHSTDSTSWYSMSSGYPMTFAGTVPSSNAWKWDPATPVMPTNYDQFMVWAEDINGVKSNEPLFNCWNDMLCVSGLMDMDLAYFNRVANLFVTEGASAGVGVRPLFAKSVTGFLGGIDNLNLLVDFKFADMVRIHTNIAYVNASLKTDAYAFATNGDLQSVYHPGAAIKMEEAYAVFSSPNSYPVYAKMGKFYLDFGQYRPNGEALPTITPSLTQLMTQTRTGGAQFGLALENGLYGSATWSISNQSLKPLLAQFNKRYASRNYSARVGMMRQYNDAYFNVNASYIWDIRDADLFVGALNVLNSYIVPALGGNFYGAFTMRRQHAYAIHGDGKYGQWGGGIEAAAVTGPLNNVNRNSNLWTAGANVNYSFPTLGHDSSIDLAYQVARHASFIQGTGVMTTFPFDGFPVGFQTNELPKNRMQVTYIAKIVKHVNAGLQWVHDKDFAPPSGTDLTSDFGVFRIDLEF
jgi:hypothetical protein